MVEEMRPRRFISKVITTASVALLCASLAGCDDEYTTAVRREASKHETLDEANAVLLARAEAGNGRDIYLFYRFLIQFVPSEPGDEFSNWRFKTQDDKDAILHCAAVAGFRRAQREARASGELPPCPL
jgi:hypothetical protein